MKWSVLIAAAVLAAAPVHAHGYKVLYAFCAQSGCADGQQPNSLIADARGNLYGTTYYGGGPGFGGIFELAHASHRYTYRLLYGFCQQTNCTDGGFPTGGLILDTSGNLYGTTEIGGNQGNGEIFELARGRKGWKLSLLYQFCPQGHDCTDGVGPDNSGLAYQDEQSGQPYDGASPLYGTTDGGGDSFNGVAYQLSPGGGGWSYQVIYSFCSLANCTDGAGPYATLALDSAGNVYGTTLDGGTENEGAVFELSNSGSGWSETTLYSLCAEANCADGSHPRSGLLIDSSGNLHGQTVEGGHSCTIDAAGCGVAFTLSAGSETLAHTFCARTDCRDGTSPQGTLAADARGNLFATAEYGGNMKNVSNGGGTLYALSGSKFRVLHAFCARASCADGGQPLAPPVRDAKGHFFGTASTGGTGGGVVYELAK